MMQKRPLQLVTRLGILQRVQCKKDWRFAGNLQTTRGVNILNCCQSLILRPCTLKRMLG